MAREDLHFRLRIPEELKKRIENAAELNMRSMTAEIIERVGYTFGPVDTAMEDLLKSIREREEEISQLKRQIDARDSEIEELNRIKSLREESLRLSENNREIINLIKDQEEILTDRMGMMLKIVCELVLSLTSLPNDNQIAMVRTILGNAEEILGASKKLKKPDVPDVTTGD